MMILVIDDEARQCRGVQKILEREYPEITISGFTEVTAAQQAILKEKPELIISDINMPKMSGLAFAEWVLAKSPNTKVIFLTGYAEFEYAKHAIQIGAFDFLVKPLDPAALLTSVARGLKKINAESLLIKDGNAPTAMTFLEEHEVAMLRGKNGQKISGVVVATILKQDAEGELATPRENEAHQSILQQFLWEEAKQWESQTFFSKKDHRILLTPVYYRESTEQSNSSQELSTLLRRWPAGAEGYFHGISPFYEDLGTMIESACAAAAESIEYGFYFPSTSVIRSEHVPKCCKVPQTQTDTSVFSKKLKQMVQYGDREGAIDLVDDYLASVIKHGYPHPQVLKRIFHDAFLDTAESLDVTLQDVCMQFLLSSDHFEIFLDRVRTLAEDLIREQLQKNRQGQSFKEMIDYYLEENYYKEISLEDVARYFDLTPSYCSFLISEETGLSFSKQLLLKRITSACSLLQKGKLRIYEISERVGYHDVKYFTRVFKREMGMTPQQYREVSQVRTNE